MPAAARPLSSIQRLSPHFITFTTTVAALSVPLCFHNLSHPQQHSQSHSSSSFSSSSSDDDTTTTTPQKLIETNLLSHLAKKPYLNIHPPSEKKYVNNNNNINNNNNNSAITNTTTTTNEKLRIISIDLPQFRTVFDEPCHIDYQKIYPDGIAYPKRVIVDIDDDDEIDNNQKRPHNHRLRRRRQETIDVIQKSIMRRLVTCGNDGNVEILEGSVEELNPKRMTRRNYKRTRRMTKRRGGGDEGGDVSDDVTKEVVRTTNEMENVSSSEEEEEEDAPWHQNAWMEELRLRVNGHIGFTDAPTRTSLMNHVFFRTHYNKTTTTPPTSSSWWCYINPFHYIPLSSSSSSSLESCNPNKPHAIIANAAAMSLVPGSLLHLARCAKDANVPLFVINDSRQWGRNTHPDLYGAAVDMRRIIKRNYITMALQKEPLMSFERGREVGRKEAERELKKKMMMEGRQDGVKGGGLLGGGAWAWSWWWKGGNNNGTDAKGRMMTTATTTTESNSSTKTKERHYEDWSQLDDIALRNELVSRGVIKVQDGKKTKMTTTTTTSDVKSEEMTTTDVVVVSVSEGMKELSRMCAAWEMTKEEERRSDDGDEYNHYEQHDNAEYM